MPRVRFIHPDGSVEIVEAAPGKSIMQAATGHGIEGIAAECGGNAMCATCHVYLVDDAGLFPRMGDAEDALLDGTASERAAESRLSCQLILTAAMSEVTVRLPEHQV